MSKASEFAAVASDGSSRSERNVSASVCVYVCMCVYKCRMVLGVSVDLRFAVSVTVQFVVVGDDSV